MFYLRIIPFGYGNIIGKTGLCVSSNYPYPSKLTQQKCGTTKDLLWTKNYLKGNYILLSYNGMVMDNNESKINNGNPVSKLNL